MGLYHGEKLNEVAWYVCVYVCMYVTWSAVSSSPRCFLSVVKLNFHSIYSPHRITTRRQPWAARVKCKCWLQLPVAAPRAHTLSAISFMHIKFYATRLVLLQQLSLVLLLYSVATAAAAAAAQRFSCSLFSLIPGRKDQCLHQNHHHHRGRDTKARLAISIRLYLLSRILFSRETSQFFRILDFLPLCLSLSVCLSNYTLA